MGEKTLWISCSSLLGAKEGLQSDLKQLLVLCHLSLSGGGMKKPFICHNVRMRIQAVSVEQLKHSEFFTCLTVTDMG